MSDADRLRAVQRALQRLATGALPDELEAALVAEGVHPDDARVLAEHPRERVGVYGGLVFATIKNTLEKQATLAAARLSRAGRLEATVRAFLAEHGPRSRYLRDIAYEIARWAEPRWRADPLVPAFVADLARYELFVFAAGTAIRGDRPDHVEELAVGRGVRLDGSVHLARFRHAVHLLPDDPDDDTVPERRDVRLLAYRDAEGEVRRLELTPLAMEILHRLAAGAALGAAIEEACRAAATPLDAGVLGGTSRVLADLADRGALLGAAPEGERPPSREACSPFWTWLVAGDQQGPQVPAPQQDS